MPSSDSIPSLFEDPPQRSIAKAHDPASNDRNDQPYTRKVFFSEILAIEKDLSTAQEMAQSGDPLKVVIDKHLAILVARLHRVVNRAICLQEQPLNPKEWEALFTFHQLLQKAKEDMKYDGEGGNGTPARDFNEYYLHQLLKQTDPLVEELKKSYKPEATSQERAVNPLVMKEPIITGSYVWDETLHLNETGEPLVLDPDLGFINPQRDTESTVPTSSEYYDPRRHYSRSKVKLEFPTFLEFLPDCPTEIWRCHFTDAENEFKRRPATLEEMEYSEMVNTGAVRGWLLDEKDPLPRSYLVHEYQPFVIFDEPERFTTPELFTKSSSASAGESTISLTSSSSTHSEVDSPLWKYWSACHDLSKFETLLTFQKATQLDENEAETRKDYLKTLLRVRELELRCRDAGLDTEAPGIDDVPGLLEEIIEELPPGSPRRHASMDNDKMLEWLSSIEDSTGNSSQIVTPAHISIDAQEILGFLQSLSSSSPARDRASIMNGSTWSQKILPDGASLCEFVAPFRNTATVTATSLHSIVSSHPFLLDEEGSSELIISNCQCTPYCILSLVGLIETLPQERCGAGPASSSSSSFSAEICIFNTLNQPRPKYYSLEQSHLWMEPSDSTGGDSRANQSRWWSPVCTTLSTSTGGGVPISNRSRPLTESQGSQSGSHICSTSSSWSGGVLVPKISRSPSRSQYEPSVCVASSKSCESVVSNATDVSSFLSNDFKTPFCCAHENSNSLEDELDVLTAELKSDLKAISDHSRRLKSIAQLTVSPMRGFPVSSSPFSVSPITESEVTRGDLQV